MGHNGMIMRRDVQIQDLSPEEKMACAQQEFNVALCQE
jgi:hypothetical protein